MYIISESSISPVDSFYFKGLEALDVPEEELLKAKEPDYKDFFDSKTRRRLSHINRMGIVAAFDALKKANVNDPDSIMCASGIGCLRDTERILNDILDSNEGLLNPALFVQSSHSSVASNLAIMLNSKSENFTYINNSTSFIHALINAKVKFDNSQSLKILVGGYDEITEEYYNVRLENGKYVNRMSNPCNRAGESANFFLLSDKDYDGCPFISFADVRYRISENTTNDKFIYELLKKNELEFEDLDLLMLGLDGSDSDKFYWPITENSFLKNKTAVFKNLCGDSNTSVSFGLWLASKVLKEGKAPAYLMTKGYSKNQIKRILLYEQRDNRNHSFLIIEKTNKYL